MKSEERDNTIRWDEQENTSATHIHPHKRRRVDSTATATALGLVSDINLEIGLRQRLAETLQSRLTWALLLKETLEREASNSAAVPDSYEEAAFEALSAIDGPAQILFDREPSPPPLVDLDARNSGRGRPPNARARQASAVDKPEFLYLRATTASGEPRTFVMSCPACNRTTFTNLQGLYNHARLAHQLAWGTHEECIRSAARLVPEDEYVRWDFARGIQVGNGSGSGMLPGLRTLFQMAVGELEEHRAAEEKRHTESVLLTQTLGLHGDSPALAPFLGRQVKKREIKAPDQDAEVDIDGVDEGMRRLRVRVPKPRRGTVPESEQIVHTQSVAPDAGYNAMQGEGSRFHISSRIVMADRSLWIPEDRRVGMPRGHTHKWMVSVDAPAYSQHITTILRSMKVTQTNASLEYAPHSNGMTGVPGAATSKTASANTISAASPVLTVTGPPFVVRGTAATAFLARIELVFGAAIPGRDDQREVYEHWVNLDPLRRGAPVLGDEQIVDVDLDRGTVFLPKRDDYTPVGSRTLWDGELGTVTEGNESTEKKGKQRRVDGREDYEIALEGLVQRFPLVMPQVKQTGGARARNPTYPYTVMATASQFCGLLIGKRKAIEWARACAIRDAYAESCGADDTVLSTADVFSWLQDNGHSIRPSTSGIEHSAIADKMDDKLTGKRSQQLQHCNVCGFYVRLHPDPEDTDRGSTRSASVVSRVEGDVVKMEETAISLQASASMPVVPSEPPPKRKPGRPKKASAPKVKGGYVRAGSVSTRAGSASVRGASVAREGSVSTVKREDKPDEQSFECNLVPKREHLRAPPIVDVEEWLRRRPNVIDTLTLPRYTTWMGPADFRQLPQLVDPALIRAVWRIARAQQLPTLSSFPRTAPPAPCPPPTELADRLAPHALLALATRAFARAVLHTALETAASDLRSLKRSLTGAPARKKKNLAADVRARILTPTHVLRGLVARGAVPPDVLGSALFMTIARVGVPHETSAEEGRNRLLAQVGDSAKSSTAVATGSGSGSRDSQDMAPTLTWPAYTPANSSTVLQLRQDSLAAGPSTSAPR